MALNAVNTHLTRFRPLFSFGWVLNSRNNSRFHKAILFHYLTYRSRQSLLSKSAGKAGSDAQKATLLENRAALLHHIEKWRQIQAVYMPGALDTETPDPEPSKRLKAESVNLWLPSQLDTKDRDAICAGSVVNSEVELRLAQLEDSLNDLRRARRTRRGLILFHKVQLAGQGQKTQTKSQAAMRTIQERIDRCVRRYRVARNALLRLNPAGDWGELYLPLTDDDNRGPGKELEETSGADGQYSPSWIWRSTSTTISPDEVNEDMRVEWAQCRARAERWEEEVTLLQEEMRRVVCFLEWRSSDWLAKVDSRVDIVAPVVHAGLSAYAKKQGAIFHNLAVQYCQRWRSTLVSLSLPHDWATKFLETHKQPLSIPDSKKRKQSEGPSAVEHRAKSPASVITPAPVPPLPSKPKTTDREAQISATDSDETSSEDDGSGDESTSSWSE